MGFFEDYKKFFYATACIIVYFIVLYVSMGAEYTDTTQKYFDPATQQYVYPSKMNIWFLVFFILGIVAIIFYFMKLDVAKDVEQRLPPRRILSFVPEYDRRFYGLPDTNTFVLEDGDTFEDAKRGNANISMLSFNGWKGGSYGRIIVFLYNTLVWKKYNKESPIYAGSFFPYSTSKAKTEMIESKEKYEHYVKAMGEKLGLTKEQIQRDLAKRNLEEQTKRADVDVEE